VRLAAFDLSLTAIGYARTFGSEVALGRPWESGVFKPGYAGPKRLWHALNEVVNIAGRVDQCDVVILEGYAYAARHQAHQLGELGGVIRLGLFQRKLPFVVIPPSKLKQFATGKGQIEKEAVIAQAVRRLGYEGYSHDEADALWLLQMGLHRYGLPGAVEMPKANRAAIEDANIKWPPGTKG